MIVALACSGLGYVRRGFEAFTEDLFNNLTHAEGVQVTLFRGGGARTPGQVPLWNIRRDSSLWRLAGGRIDPYIGEQITFALALARHLKRRDFDVVHLSDGQVASILLRLFPDRSRKFRIIFSNGGPLSPAHYEQFDYVQQVNPVEYDNARSYGLNEKTMTLLPYGVSVNDFSVEKSESIRGKLGIPDDAILLLTVGSDGGHKRLDFLLQGAALVKDDVHLLIVGGQGARGGDRLQAVAKKLLGDRVTFVSLPHQEMPSVYTAADVYVHGALREGCCLAILEAMAAGVPVVHHDEPGLNWIVGNGGTAVNMTELDRFSHVINTLLKDTTSRKRLGRLAWERVESEFSWQILLPRYIEMYDRASRTGQVRSS